MGFHMAPEFVEETDDAFGVWRENWESVQAFLRCQTQWRVVPRHYDLLWTGLDYVAVDVVLRRGNFGDHVFEDIRFLEREALVAFDEVPE